MTADSSAGALAKRQFGRTGLLVHPLCVGCAPLGNMPADFGYAVSEDTALATVRAAFDSPINFMDTAAMYGDGESERRIGMVIRERGGLPSGFVLATKADRDMTTNYFGGDQARRSVERSLRLLGLARFQVLYLHDAEYSSWEQVTGPGGALEALLRYREEGIIQHLGVAGGPIDVMMRYVALGVFEAVITHNRWNLLNRDAEPLLTQAHARGMAVVNAAPYGSGILAKGPEGHSRFMYREASPELVARTRRIQAICASYGVPMAAAALQFSLREPRITSTIVGMTRPERVAQTLSLATYPIPDGLWQELAAVIPAAGK